MSKAEVPTVAESLFVSLWQHGGEAVAKEALHEAGLKVKQLSKEVLSSSQSHKATKSPKMAKAASVPPVDPRHSIAKYFSSKSNENPNKTPSGKEKVPPEIGALPPVVVDLTVEIDAIQIITDPSDVYIHQPLEALPLSPMAPVASAAPAAPAAPAAEKHALESKLPADGSDMLSAVTHCDDCMSRLHEISIASTFRIAIHQHLMTYFHTARIPGVTIAVMLKILESLYAKMRAHWHAIEGVLVGAVPSSQVVPCDFGCLIPCHNCALKHNFVAALSSVLEVLKVNV